MGSIVITELVSPDRVNGSGRLPTHVVSSTLEDRAWNDSTVLNSAVVDEVSKLNRNLEDIAAALRDAMDDLETVEWRGVDPLWGRKP